MTYEQIRQAEADGSLQIIENRPKPAVDKNGSMTGAFLIPAPTLLTEDGTMKSEQEIREIFEGKGVDVSKPMAFTCGGAIMATYGMAGAVKAQLPGEKYLYDGSWSEFNARRAKEQEAQ